MKQLWSKPQISEIEICLTECGSAGDPGWNPCDPGGWWSQWEQWWEWWWHHWHW